MPEAWQNPGVRSVERKRHLRRLAENSLRPGQQFDWSRNSGKLNASSLNWNCPANGGPNKLSGRNCEPGIA